MKQSYLRRPVGPKGPGPLYLVLHVITEIVCTSGLGFCLMDRRQTLINLFWHIYSTKKPQKLLATINSAISLLEKLK